MNEFPNWENEVTFKEQKGFLVNIVNVKAALLSYEGSFLPALIFKRFS